MDSRIVKEDRSLSWEIKQNATDLFWKLAIAVGVFGITVAAWIVYGLPYWRR